HIQFEGALDQTQTAAILSLGATLESEHHIRYFPAGEVGETNGESANGESASGETSSAAVASATLYKILHILEPLPLLEVRQDRADLTDVFLQLVRI
ncbi:MAG: hypothetical protein WBG63_07475, partial [Phormidesmis sp.]